MIGRPIYRQGDVLLNMVGGLPPRARVTAVAANAGRLILAFGEQSGHAHAVPEADAELLDVATADQVDRYLRVRARTVLHHEEHAPIILEPGLYHVGIQRTFSPPATVPAPAVQRAQPRPAPVDYSHVRRVTD